MREKKRSERERERERHSIEEREFVMLDDIM